MKMNHFWPENVDRLQSQGPLYLNPIRAHPVNEMAKHIDLVRLIKVV